MKTTSLLYLCLFLFGLKSYAQQESSIHATIPIPILNFGGGAVDDFYTDASIPPDEFGYAGLGLGLGYDHTRALNDRGLILSFGADLTWNPIKRAVRNDFVEDEQWEYTFSDYINLPLRVGLGYQRTINESIRLGICVSPIMNLMKVTKSSSTHYFYGSLEEVSTREDSYTLGTSLGIGLEGRAMIQDTYVVGLGFNFLGNYNLKKRSKNTYDSNQLSSPEIEEEVFDWSTSVSLVTLSVGIIITNK